MSALALISELSKQGIKVRSKGENLALSPKAKLTPALLERVRSEKPALLQALEGLQHDLGDDWTEIAAEPRHLKAAYELQMIVEMREQGIVPDHYTATTECRRCGPVPIWEGCPPAVLGCPWCFNRHKGLPVPRK